MIASRLPKRMDPNTVLPLSVIRPKNGMGQSLVRVHPLHKVPDATTFNILLVIQDKKELDTLSLYLADSFRLLTARNEKGVIKTMESQSIHLIISHVGIFNGKGNDFIAQVKSSVHYAHIPVILLIDQNSMEAKIKSMESGADAHIERPLSREMLKAQIKNLIANRARIKDYFAHSLFAHMTTSDCSKEKEKFLNKLNGFISENLPKKDLNVDFLARLMNMSRPTLYRKIRSISDLTPNELINVTRLNRAAGLLSGSDHKIAEIAKMVGFHWRRNFGKAFLKHFNVIPSAYQHLI
jgi:two-component system, cell cycle response regulator